MIITQIHENQIGRLVLGEYQGQLCLCDWEHRTNFDKVVQRIQKMHNSQFVYKSSKTLDIALKQLDEYFAINRKAFTVPLLFTGTSFQKQVWQLLLQIPYGIKISYGRLSEQLNSPLAVRAVASANAANSLAIFVPCHRVIGNNLQLTGYSGGLEAKRILLQLEDAKSAQRNQLNLF